MHARAQDRATGARPGRREGGQSLVEMALVVPLLVLILAVVIDSARVFDALIVLTNAAREGARFAVLEPAPTQAQIETLVLQDVTGSGTNITHMDDISADDVDVALGTTAITVTVSYDFDLWFGGLLGVPTIRVSRRAAMPLYYPEPGS